MIEYDYDKHTEEIQDKLKACSDDILDTLQSQMSELWTEYIPHIDYDYGMNVKIQAENIIKDLLSGRKTKHYSLSGYNAKQLRDKIYQENKQEVNEAIEKDLLEKLDNMKSKVDFMERERRFGW